jgi:hypothetical protein
MQKEFLETETSRRGILRGFGLKVRKTTPVGFAGRIRELVAGHPSGQEPAFPKRGPNAGTINLVRRNMMDGTDHAQR